MFAEVFEAGLDFPLDLITHRGRNKHLADVAHFFQSGRHIHAVPVDVVLIHDDIAKIDPDPQLETLVQRHVLIPPGEHALNADGAIDRAGKLDQHPFAGGLDDTAVLFGDAGIEDFLAQSLELGERSGLVGMHQAAEADHVGRQDCRKPSLDAFFRHASSHLNGWNSRCG